MITFNNFFYINTIKFCVISFLSDDDLINRMNLVCKAFLTLTPDYRSYQATYFVIMRNKRLPVILSSAAIMSITNGHTGIKMVDQKVERDFQDGIIQRHGKSTYPNGNVYEGSFQNGKKHGHGKLTYHNGDVYEGDFQDGKLQGHGKLTLSNGDVCEGNFQDGIIHGQGKSFWNGNVYEGSIQNNKKHGKGKLIYSNGNVYEGDFQDGNRHGHGKLTYPNGNAYEGDFQDNKPHGQGKLTLSNGEVYEGSYQDGKKHGQGKLTLSNGNVYEANFQDGIIQGKGKSTFSNGNVYEGDFQDGKRHGQGKLTQSNGNVYEGDFQDGIIQGKGKFTYSNGNVYEGDFQDGRLHGKGKLTFSNGNVYEGDFQDSNMHGQGKLIHPNGNVYEGVFQEGKMQAQGKLTFSNGDVYEESFQDDKKHGQGKLTPSNGNVLKVGFQDGKLLNLERVIQQQETPFYIAKKQELKLRLKAKEQFCEKIKLQKSALVERWKSFLKEQNQFDSFIQKLKPAMALEQKPSADFLDELSTKQKELIAASGKYENEMKEALETCKKTLSPPNKKKGKKINPSVKTPADKLNEVWDVAKQKFELAKSAYSGWISDQEVSIASQQSSNQKTLQLLESNLETCETLSEFICQSDSSLKENFEQNQAHYDYRIVELNKLSEDFQVLRAESLQKIDDIKQDSLMQISITDDVILRAHLAQSFQTNLNEVRDVFLKEKQSLSLMVRSSDHLGLADLIETRAKDLNQKKMSDLRQELIEKKREVGQKERELKKNNEHLKVVLQENENLKANLEDEQKKAKLVKFKMIKEIEELRRQVIRHAPNQHPEQLKEQCENLCDQLLEQQLAEAEQSRFIKVKKFLKKNSAIDTDQKCIDLLKLLGYVEDGIDSSHHYYVNKHISPDLESFCLARHGADYHIEDKKRDVLRHAVIVMTHYKTIFLFA